jgi:uncharacterized protein DUF6812
MTSEQADRRNESVVIETVRHRIIGMVLLPTRGYRRRLSDFLNAAERDFIAITDAVVAPLDAPEKAYKTDFVAVGREHIVIAMPEPGTGD